MRTAPEDVLDETGEVPPGPDLDKDPDAVGVHGLDRGPERDGEGPLLARQAADRLDLLAHPAGGRARVKRHPGTVQRQVIEERADRPQRLREGGGVIRAGERKGFADHPLAAEPVHDRFDGAGGPGQHHLMRTVVDGNRHTVVAGVAAGALDLRAVGREGDQARTRHPARGLEVLEDPPQLAEPVLEPLIDADRARCGQRQEFSAAVADDRVGMQVEARQQLVQGPLPREHNVERRADRPEAATLVHRSAEEDLAGKPGISLFEGHAVGRVEPGADLGEVRQRSASMPGYCEPSPGNRNASAPELARGCSQK